ncbi:hypothetical protein [Aquipseudomonas campi]
MHKQSLSAAMQQAIAEGLREPSQIISTIRRNGAWFIQWVAK